MRTGAVPDGSAGSSWRSSSPWRPCWAAERGFAASQGQRASAAVDDGKSFQFPTEKLDTAIAYWMSRGFPFGRRTDRIDMTDPNDPTNSATNRVGFIMRGGFFLDTASGDLTEFIRNTPGTQEPQLLEYDIDIRPTRGHEPR